LLESLVARFELLEQLDLPFPLGGCFGYWGYGLKNFVEPRLRRGAPDTLEMPDCHLGFYSSLVAFDHQMGKTWVVTTGLGPDATRDPARARRELAFWRAALERPPWPADEVRPLHGAGDGIGAGWPETDWVDCAAQPARGLSDPASQRFLASQGGRTVRSTLSRVEFIGRVERALRYIRSGDIYQVNLSQRLAVPYPRDSWSLFRVLKEVSPAPFAAYLDCGQLQLASSSPELFLGLSGSHILTRPIKGTRPRSPDPVRDSQLAAELLASPKERAELVMITDLLRNDLGRVCEFGSVQVPELIRLERYAQVQHLVSTVEGRLRGAESHVQALERCFPGGSITGAPKVRAMEVIDELEPCSRGPYTGALGYLGFNRESQLSIIIRTAICQAGWAHFPVGAGIVADSDPAAEYEETLAKARGFLEAYQRVCAPLAAGAGHG
jgi:para-aminobenzoate synthetase component 1